ncbi:ankyrin repeat domain-containing protein 26-like [Molossus nigricans]
MTNNSFHKSQYELIEQCFKVIGFTMESHSESQEHSSSIQRHLELRIRDLESEILKMQTVLHFNNMDMKNYMALYQEELEKRKLLENELNETKNKMVQVRAELFQQKENYRDLLSTIRTRPVLQTPCAVNTNSNTDTGCMPSTQCTPGKRAALPIIEEMMKEFDKKVEEALKDDVAEFAYECHEAHPGRSIDLSKSSQELYLEAKQEYTECSKKQYMLR